MRPRNLASLGGHELTAALRSYVSRAQRGQADSVLVAGTNKDLIEAAAAQVLLDRYGSAPEHVDFPTLLGQAFPRSDSMRGLRSLIPAALQAPELQWKSQSTGWDAP